MPNDLKDYIRKRNAILVAFDVDKMLEFMRQNGKAVPQDRDVAIIMMHLARTNVATLPMEIRRVSKRWIRERGIASLDNGDV